MMVQKRNKVLNWDDLEAVLHVARSGSIRAAALVLNTAHTTLARRIEAAEASLDAKLFLRGSKGYALTPAGRLTLSHIERMAEEAAALRRKSHIEDRAPEGLVRVSLPPAVLTICLTDHLHSLQAAYPGIRLDFDMRYSLADLDHNESDIAIRYQRKPPDHLVGTKIGQSVEVAYAAADVRRRFMAHEPVALIAWSRGEAFAKRAKALGLAHLPVVVSCQDVEGQLRMAEAGLGIAVLPSLVGGSSKLIRPLSNKQQVIASPIWVLSHPDLVRSPRVRVVKEFLTKTMRKVLAARTPQPM